VKSATFRSDANLRSTMAYSFTPVIKTLQERYGSRRQYAKREASGFSQDGFGPAETDFLVDCDSFYLATVGATGWPYVQHRGGPKGFLKVIDKHTVAFADFRGNKQFISTGNLMTDDRVALILVDYPRQARLKILGHVKVVEGPEAREWIEKLNDPEYDAVVERVFVIHVDAFDWNCQQHIMPRFTEAQIRDALAPIEDRIRSLEMQNQSLRRQLADRSQAPP
jgi:predicted pyridoxine 5'-phosphate oxidase superfamily flavin-nucleotide-binding protein